MISTLVSVLQTALPSAEFHPLLSQQHSRMCREAEEAKRSVAQEAHTSGTEVAASVAQEAAELLA